MAVVYSKVLLFDPPLIYTAPDICVFGAVVFMFILVMGVVSLIRYHESNPPFLHYTIRN